MFIVSLGMLATVAGVSLTASTEPALPVDTIQQLRLSELQQRRAQAEAQRLQLELQIAQAKHAIARLQPTATATDATVESSLKAIDLISVIDVAEQTLILIREAEQLVTLVAGEPSVHSLTATVIDGIVRLQRFGYFRDIPLPQGW